MSRFSFVTGTVLALIVSRHAAAPRAQQMTDDTAAIVERWANAVERHAPGVSDAAVGVVLSLSSEVRDVLPLTLKVFFGVLREPPDQVLHDKAIFAKLTSTTAVDRMQEAARDAALRLGARAFLERAATLHADAAVLAATTPVSANSGSGNGRVIGHSGDDSVRPSTGRLIVARDGESIGTIEENWNWRFARSLLDLIPRPADDPFVAVWYHATSAYLLRNGLYAQARAHLDRGAALLPNDARILFDRACLFEAFGLPFSQVLVSDEARLAARFANQPGQMIAGGHIERNPLTDPLKGGPFDNIPSQDDANAEAERLFRRSLDADPAFVEARVRFARLLEVRGRHKEAEAELTTALTRLQGSGDPVLSFYAHLFAARTDRALGRLDVAARHAREALLLFPDAQSALIEQSQIALLSSDEVGALAPMRRLAALPSDVASRSDPWWQYHLGPGRDVDRVMREMWEKAR